MKKSHEVLPGISKKLAYRTLGFVIVVGGLIYGIEWWQTAHKDLGQFKTAETTGWIAAIEYKPQGQEAVLISGDGKVHTESGYKQGVTDTDIVWSPKGNFLYFVSDREEHNYNVYRWSPADPVAERKTIGTRARSSPRFAVLEDAPDGSAKPLITSGGVVQEFDPVNSSTEQILPPTSKEITQTQGSDESGIESQFQGAYGDLGTSFRLAEWCGEKKFIAAIMRRERGEVLVVQAMTADKEGKLPNPEPVMAGDHVDFAVNPHDGSIVFAVQGFQWPTTEPVDASGKPQPKPFLNGIGMFSPTDNGLKMIVKDDQTGFGSPAVKPDGSTIAVVFGKVENGAITPVGLTTLPTTHDTTFKPIRILGEVHEPSWSPDGTHLVYAMREKGGKRALYDFQVADGTNRNITGDTGDFGSPRYSPQKSGG